MECENHHSNQSLDSTAHISQKVNNTSGLQIHSIMYRFHPSVKWTKGYPDRQQIVSQIRELWEAYDLDERTKFNTKVNKVYKDEKGRWIINDPSNGRFDGIIAAVGTCGDPKMVNFIPPPTSGDFFNCRVAPHSWHGKIPRRDISLVAT